MIHFTKALVARWLEKLLHIADTPERTAAAFAMGVFFGFSPFLGFHTLLALLVAFLLNLNRVAVLLGVYSNLPWIIGAYYASVTALGAALTGTAMPPGMAGHFRRLFSQSIFHRAFWNQLILLLQPLLWPYTVGSMIGAVTLAAIAYPAALAFVRNRRHLRHDSG
jgi:uncharacterized protein (DUF2062 family)